MTSERLGELRYEYLVSVGTAGGYKAGFKEWLREFHMDELLEHYAGRLDELIVNEAATVWERPFQKADPSAPQQLSLGGMPCPEVIRFRASAMNPDSIVMGDDDRGNKVPGGYLTVLTAFATFWQWDMALDQKQISIEADMLSLRKERGQYRLALGRAHGNPLARVADYIDGGNRPRPPMGDQPTA